MFVIFLSLLLTTAPAPQCNIDNYYTNGLQDFSADNPLSAPVFDVPAALMADVAFWRDVFQTDTSKIIIHDRDNLNIVWGIETLPRDKFGNVDEVMVPKFIKKTLSLYSSRIKRVNYGVIKDSIDQSIFKTGTKNGNNLKFYNNIRAQRGISDHFESGIQNYKRWKPTISKILKEEGVPLEIIALPFVESSYNNSARSYCKAFGIWQIMPSTGRWLGLKVSRHYDQRGDILLSTRAAAKLLRVGYQELGSWELSLLSYNVGIGNVKKASKKVKSIRIEKIVDYEGGSFKFAAQNYYAEFLAALSLVKDRGLL